MRWKACTPRGDDWRETALLVVWSQQLQHSRHLTPGEARASAETQRRESSVSGQRASFSEGLSEFLRWFSWNRSFSNVFSRECIPAWDVVWEKLLAAML